MIQYDIEKLYILSEEESGVLFLYMHAKEGVPYDSTIIYDGKDHAVFQRNPRQCIILDYIHPDDGKII